MSTHHTSYNSIDQLRFCNSCFRSFSISPFPVFYSVAAHLPNHVTFSWQLVLPSTNTCCQCVYRRPIWRKFNRAQCAQWSDGARRKIRNVSHENICISPSSIINLLCMFANNSKCVIRTDGEWSQSTDFTSGLMQRMARSIECNRWHDVCWILRR